MVMFSFLILGTAFVFLGRSYVISEYRDNMVSNAEEVSHAAQALVRDGELSNWDLRMVISTLAQSTGNHIFITDTDGTIVSCSCRNIACEHLGRTVGAAHEIQSRFAHGLRPAETLAERCGVLRRGVPRVHARRAEFDPRTGRAMGVYVDVREHPDCKCRNFSGSIANLEPIF